MYSWWKVLLLHNMFNIATKVLNNIFYASAYIFDESGTHFPFIYKQYYHTVLTPITVHRF